MIYVHERFDVSSPINILESVNGWEYVCIEIPQSIPFPQNIIIANIYRPPCEILETFTTFLREFVDWLALHLKFGSVYFQQFGGISRSHVDQLQI